MPSEYLQAADYDDFGVEDSQRPQIIQASAMIDGFLRRTHGLLYADGADGQPCYMTSPGPEFTLTAAGDFGPGNGIAVQATGPVAALQVGDCLVLDRENKNKTEVVQVTSMNGNTIVLGTSSANTPNGVQFAHSAGCKMEAGLVITERKYVPKNRSEVTLGYAPVARVIGGTGRYGYGRRGDSAAYNTDNFNLLASLSKFGGPPAWEIWPANSSAGIEPYTGQLWIPAGIMLAYYSEVRVRYVAGYTYGNLPDQIKMACAQLVQVMLQNPTLGNAKSMRAGDTAIEQFAASILSDDVKALLQPFKARMFA